MRTLSKSKSVLTIIVMMALFGFTDISSAQVKIVNAYPNLNFNQPTDYQVADSSSGFVYVTERPGRILRLENNSKTSSATTVLDISDQISTTGEGGLLGLAFHPNYTENGLLFVYYTAPAPFRSVVSRFEANTTTGSVDKSSETVIFELDQPYTNHNGGQIRFGHDGYLYIALGDGGSGGDPMGNGQDRTTLLGSMLRIDVDQSRNEQNYTIPSDNPFFGNEEGFKEEIFAYGLRNPYRFSFDAETGELWTGDVGQNKIEEVDIIRSGQNYGWNTMEGSECYSPATGCDTSGLTMPVYEYDHSVGQSITGGFVYRGSAIPDLQGAYVYADFISNNVWYFEYDGEKAMNNTLIDEIPSVIAFGEDENRELFLCSINGTIYKLVPDNTTSVESEMELPESTALLYNYPNPFNPYTTISIQIPEAASVEVSIYDMLGNKITTLADRQMSSGNHSFRFDASDLTSGIYICRLKTSSGITETRKITFLK